MKHDGWITAGTDLGLNLDPQQAERLGAFEALLRDKAIPAGMISPADRHRLVDRHLVDSLRGAALVAPSDRDAADLGSGAGLPGVVIAIAVPELKVTLTETRRSRISFLELAIEELGLRNVVVHGANAKALDPSSQDLCFARAFMDAAASWGVAEPSLRPGGSLIYWAGAGFSSSDIPEDVRFRETPAGELARSGPLVMMARQ